MNSIVTSIKRETLIVIGNGMVGHHCVEQLIASGALHRYQVHVYGEERQRAYDRVHLSEYFSGKDAEALALGEPGLYTRNGVHLHLGEPVLEIDRDKREIVTTLGRRGYDRLVLATGSYPFVPPIPGAEGNSRLVYRTLDDLDGIRAAATKARRGVVVGGGLLGLEAANALKSLGLEAHVVEFAPRLMPVQLDADGGDALRARIEALGVGVHLSRATQEIVVGEEYAYRMNFSDGADGKCEYLETDLIVFSAGIRPQDALGRAAGLEVAPRGGVVVDNDCRSSDPFIYAIGECASWNGMVFGLVAPGYSMARNVAAQLAGAPHELFTGADMSTKLKLLGVDVGSIGDAHAATPGAKSYRYIDEANASYRRLVVSPDGQHVIGAVLVGDNSYYDTLLQYAQNGIQLPADPSSLILPLSDGAPTLGADALPDTATLCSCHNVSKGAVCCQVDAGITDLGELKAITKAGSGCGGCSALLKQVFEHELSARGVAVDKSLCEHFAHTRQELYAIVRVEGVLSFEELLAKHGRGYTGCDICKPAVGSILASCWNQPITDPALIPLQDTNDTFMANMQKNGTEAQSKDIGVIATDKGWNLYVCGNGGMRPRHAELLATDLDDEALIRTIDRVLMFYIRTADKLQRTSVWRESLEGGLDYLKAVILDDSLNLAAELEAQMQLVVDRYECEWAGALNDPEKLKRFRTFVNDKRGDPDIHFVKERGQRRPITASELHLIPVTEEVL
nr:nitrite reductase large subunit NirB [Pseudomonas sp.]